MADGDALLGTEEAAKLLGVARSTIDTRRRDGRLPSESVAGRGQTGIRFLFKRSDIEALREELYADHRTGHPVAEPKEVPNMYQQVDDIIELMNEAKDRITIAQRELRFLAARQDKALDARMKVAMNQFMDTFRKGVG